MMQQPMQQDQMNPQQQMAQQQMMLCPVRLVYETPILVQQGDQMQNQNIFINPQNPPPWARPVQNQVIYLQQMQPNVVSIQHMDSNQLYLHQNYNYQQVIPQNLMQQTTQDHMRIPMQLQHVTPNMIQSVQNIGGNTHIQPNEPVAQTMQSYQIQANPQNVQNQMQMVTDANNRQYINVQSTQVMNQNANQKAMETPRQAVYRTMMPQSNMMQRPPMQIANTIQNLTNVQQISPNVNQNFIPNTRPTMQNVNIQQHMQPTLANLLSSGQETERKAAPNIVSMNNSGSTVTYSAVRNGQSYTFRAIQPKPPQRNVFTQSMPMQRQNLPVQMPNVNLNNQRNVIPNMVQASTSANIKTEANVHYNRKRKSESPDEIQKKMAGHSTVYGSITVTTKMPERSIAKNIKTLTDIGVNTSPVHKLDDKKNQLPILQINPLEDQAKRIKEEHKTMNPSMPLLIPSEKVLDESAKCVTNASQQTEKEKLVRNTVFPQARGRLLSDKPIQVNVNTDQNIAMEVSKPSENVETIKVPVAHVFSENPKVLHDIILKQTTATNTSIIPNTQTIKNEVFMKPNAVTSIANAAPAKNIETAIVNTPMSVPDMNVKTIDDTAKSNDSTFKSNNITDKAKDMPNLANDTVLETNKNVLKKDTRSKLKDETSTSHDIAAKTNDIIPQADVAIVKNETVEDSDTKVAQTEIDSESAKERKDYKNLSVSDMKDKEIHIVGGNIVKEEKDFILTHVLDGYVIQESNVPFAIRKPLKEKTINLNTTVAEKTDDDKSKVLKDNSKILEISHLNISDADAKDLPEETEEKGEIKENPFVDIAHNTVKSWTVGELSSHLTKFSWQETISILQDHEIDGESLLLVSKQQLVTIGVSENHAEIICEFVSSKSK